MGDSNKLIDLSTLNEMLYGEEAYIKEFAEAALTSFSEFKENYCLYLLNEDEINFRKTGHKIKPVAQMLGLEQIVSEYEHAKSLLQGKIDSTDLEKSCTYMTSICETVLTELKELCD